MVTHGLVSCPNCGWMVKNKDFPFKLPASGWVDKRRYHHHSFPDLRTFNLKWIKQFLTQVFMSNQVFQIFTFFNAKEAVCPPLTSLTGIRLRCILLITIGVKLPTGSGPSRRVSFKRMVPRMVVPETTVPTPGTEYESSIENSGGSSAPGVIRALNRFKNIFSKSKFKPETFDTWKIGHNLTLKIILRCWKVPWLNY